MSVERIRELNDQFRKNLDSSFGLIVMTRLVADSSEDAKTKVLGAVRAFDDFTERNDPHGEHDFGAFEIGDERFFWKIDYYDLAMKYGSEDPADTSKTTRVLTIMYREEY
jgi:hypothetical protein